MTRHASAAPRAFALGAWIVLAAASVRADVALAPIFRDGAVLQRSKPLPIWGTASPGETVNVRFAGQDVATTADASGRWVVTIAPLEASAKPAELVVQGRNQLRVSDVLVGEVWFCAGQSNMAFRLSRATGAKADIAAAKFPLLRQFDVPVTVGNPAVTPTIGRWTATTPEIAPYFTALGYHFALELHRALGVPIGFIRCAVGGTIIEAWLGRETFARDSALAPMLERWDRAQAEGVTRRAAHAKAVAVWETDAAAARAQGAKFDRKKPVAPPEIAHNEPGVLFRTMVAPLAPYALRGFLWYQGESNHRRPEEYAALFAAMVTDWRREFRQGTVPFYFVQLPDFDEPKDPSGLLWAKLRDAQAAGLNLPATGMAVSIDVGDPKDVHPPNKPEIARRLARIARAQVYGESIAWESPRKIDVVRAGGTMRVRWSAAEGLHLRGAGRGMELAGADRVFHPATYTIEGDVTVVRAPAVPAPVAVRYAWKNAPDVSLFNGAGLPAAPFRSDDW